MLITVSGAHGSGKTTLIAAFVKWLDNSNKKHFLIPSYSKTLLEKLRWLGLKKYDDINSHNLREPFQYLLVGELLNAIQLIQQIHTTDPDTIIVCDRWISDALVYAHLEISEQFEADRILKYNQVLEKLASQANEQFLEQKIIVNQFYIDYKPFSLQEKPSRSTLDPLIFDNLFFELHARFIKTPLIHIDTADIDNRLQFLTKAL